MKSTEVDFELTGNTSLPAWECGLKSIWHLHVNASYGVTPCVGVWIEISIDIVNTGLDAVTPCVGVWIEISYIIVSNSINQVTPCVGVWIEINSSISSSILTAVTPCVGVWIEI